MAVRNSDATTALQHNVVRRLTETKSTTRSFLYCYGTALDLQVSYTAYSDTLRTVTSSQQFDDCSLAFSPSHPQTARRLTEESELGWPLLYNKVMQTQYMNMVINKRSSSPRVTIFGRICR